MAVYANKIPGISLGSDEDDVRMLIPDFPFDYEQYLANSTVGLGNIPQAAYGTEIAVVGGGMAGIVAAYELMRMGLKPIVYESDRIGGRFRAHGLGSGLAEMGAMRFPPASAALFYYINLLNLKTDDFPNPLTVAAHSTLIDLLGKQYYVDGTGGPGSPHSLPQKFVDLSNKWDNVLQANFNFTEMQTAIKERNIDAIKSLWDKSLSTYESSSFYEFLVSAGFTYNEIYTFGQVGFGSGGWNTDFPNSILEIMRVVYTNADNDHKRIIGGTTALLTTLWAREIGSAGVHWPANTSINSLNDGATSPEVKAIHSGQDGLVIVQDVTGRSVSYKAIVITPEKRVLQSGSIIFDESLIGESVRTGMYNTHYQLSGKVFSEATSAIWAKKDEAGLYPMSMTLSDRVTRGTYLFDESGNSPVVCLSYTWNDDTLKFLPFGDKSDTTRFDRCVDVLMTLYPKVDFAKLFTGSPLSLIWDDLPYFIGAFKNNLPGHYRYQRALFTAFKEDAVSTGKGVFFAGDDISWTGGWSEGAIHTSLNAVWGIMNHLGGESFPNNPGPGDAVVYNKYKPTEVPD